MTIKKCVLLFVVSILFMSLTSNKYYPKYTFLNIIMNDGKMKSGKMKNPIYFYNRNSLIYEDGSIEKINFSDAKELVVKTNNGVSLVYEKVKVYKDVKKNQISEPEFMLVILKGPVNLYNHNYQIIPYFHWDLKYFSKNTYVHSIIYGMKEGEQEFSNHKEGIGLEINGDELTFYAKRDDEPAATYLSYESSMGFGSYNTFKNNAPEYFKDYTELATKINNKSYTYKDLIPLVMEYNDWKNKN